MTIKDLLEDSQTSQKHVRDHFDVSKALVSYWYNISVPIKRHDDIKKYLVKKAKSFIKSYE